MSKEKTNEKRSVKVKEEESTTKWIISIFVLTFISSLFFSYISEQSIKGIPVIPAILILILIMLIGIVFDIIGVAVTVANEDEFHAKASKKLKGSRTAIKLIRNSHKVSNFCADVVGDIAGVLSGAISALIAFKITEAYNLSINLQFLISALVASLTVGGKAIGKIIARKNTTKIVVLTSKLLQFFERKK